MIVATFLASSSNRGYKRVLIIKGNYWTVVFHYIYVICVKNTGFNLTDRNWLHQPLVYSNPL